MNDPDNHAAYDANMNATYDPDIVPFLDAPIGSAFERENGPLIVKRSGQHAPAPMGLRMGEPR